jgi:hypothetical protein
MTDGTGMERRCRADRCSGPDGEPRHVEGDWLQCRSCSHRGYLALTGLPLRYVRLNLALRPGSPPSERVSGGAGFASSSPVRDEALNVMQLIGAFTVEADREVRGVLRMAPAPTMIRPSVATGKAVADLMVQWDRVQAHRVALWASGTALTLSGRADRVLGWDKLVHRLPAPCPYCDLLTLIRRDGDSLVRCTQCSRSWIETEYRHFVRMLVEDVG